MNDRFTVAIYDVDGVSRAEFVGEVQDISFSTQEPGGCLEFHCAILRPAVFVPSWIGAAYQVRIQDSWGTFWIGRMERPEAVFTPNGEWWEFTAVGYGASLSDQIDLTENLQGVVTSAGIGTVVTSHAPKITSQTITASGFTLDAAAAITRTFDTPAERINFLKEFGYSDDAQMLVHVYPKDNAVATVEITVKKRPTTPDYTMSMRQAYGRLGFDFANYANQIVGVYNSGTLSSVRNNTAAQGAGPAGVNVIKAKLLSMPELTLVTDINQASDVLLDKSDALKMDARQIVVPAGAIILDSNDQIVPHWRVRSGKVMRLIDLETAEGAQSNLSWHNSFLIVRTNWDDNGQLLTLMPENFEGGIEGIIARSRHATEAGSRIT